MKKIKQLFLKLCMHNRADKRGWQMIGQMLGLPRDSHHDLWSRKIRQSNRLYRLGHGKSPWKKFGRF